MFTGIIQDLGLLKSKETIDGDIRFTFSTKNLPLKGVNLGDSIAVNGVCLTAIEISGNDFAVDASLETLELTSLGSIFEGEVVNLELAMTPQTAFGGHIVSGHVDALAEIVEMYEEARSWRFGILVPEKLRHLVATKGSLTIDGVSLTVNSITDEGVAGVNIIPHTMEMTRFSEYKVGTKVNIEIDLIARYLERLLQERK